MVQGKDVVGVLVQEIKVVGFGSRSRGVWVQGIEIVGFWFRG